MLLVHPCAVTTVTWLYYAVKRCISQENSECSFRYSKVVFEDLCTQRAHIWEQSALNNLLYGLNSSLETTRRISMIKVTLRFDNCDGNGSVRSLGRAGLHRVGLLAKIEITNLIVGAPGPKNDRFVHPTPQKRFDSGLLLFDISRRRPDSL